MSDDERDRIASLEGAVHDLDKRMAVAEVQRGQMALDLQDHRREARDGFAELKALIMKRDEERERRLPGAATIATVLTALGGSIGTIVAAYTGHLPVMLPPITPTPPVVVPAPTTDPETP